MKSRRGQHSFRLFLSIDAFFTLSWYFHPSTLNRLPRMYFTYIGILNCCRAIEIFELFVAKTSVDGTLIAPWRTEPSTTAINDSRQWQPSMTAVKEVPKPKLLYIVLGIVRPGNLIFVTFSPNHAGINSEWLAYLLIKTPMESSVRGEDFDRSIFFFAIVEKITISSRFCEIFHSFVGSSVASFFFVRHRN